MSEKRLCESKIANGQNGLFCAVNGSGEIRLESRAVYICEPCLAVLTESGFCTVHGIAHVLIPGPNRLIACPRCEWESDNNWPDQMIAQT